MSHHRGNRNRRPPIAARQKRIDICNANLKLLPDLLAKLPGIDATASEVINFTNTQALDPVKCPLFTTNCEVDGPPGTTIRVVNADSFDAACDLLSKPVNPRILSDARDKGITMLSRPLVMNFASDKNPGGGWRTGAMAQEEALCYQSSLPLSLHEEHYPFKALDATYTKDVVNIRDEDHNLLAPEDPKHLPVFSVVSVAALRRPELDEQGGYKRNGDLEMMRQKIRLTLRIAGTKGHTRLVLGAFGCGAFKNPVGVVAQLWKEVLLEDEFKGGWWDEVVFAVLSKDDGDENSNFAVFERVLNGLVI